MVFELVFPTFFVVVAPPVGVGAVNFSGHHTGEDRISAILGRSGQDAEEEVFFLEAERFADDGFYDAPLVVAEVVEQEEDGRYGGIHLWEDLAAQEVIGHDGAGLLVLYPGDVVLCDIFAKSGVRVPFLVG